MLVARHGLRIISTLLAAGWVTSAQAANVIGQPAPKAPQQAATPQQLVACTDRLKTIRDQRSALMASRTNAQNRIAQLSSQPPSDQRDQQIDALRRTVDNLNTQISQLEGQIASTQPECERLRAQVMQQCFASLTPLYSALEQSAIEVARLSSKAAGKPSPETQKAVALAAKTFDDRRKKADDAFARCEGMGR